MSGPTTREGVPFRVFVFAFGSGCILFGVSSRDGLIALATGFAIVLFMVAPHIARALRGRNDD
jgi:hypothetical protein